VGNVTGESDPWAVGYAVRALVVLALAAAFFVSLGWVPIVSLPPVAGGTGSDTGGPVVVALENPTPVPTPAAIQPTPSAPHIGIIAGHSGNDSGAVCPDGLREVDINADAARRVVALLTQRGWQVDLLDEFDPRLENYQAQAILSIHSDSCLYPGKSGFKVARAESSYIPNNEDRLVRCIIKHYQERTGMAFDANTITYDMTRYHAYYEIDKNTAAAIIEIGFMLDDREMLTERSDVVALGIAEGLICYIEGESP